MTKEEALKVLVKMRAWREWGKEQIEEERPEMPEQKEVDEAFDVCIKLLQSFLPSNLDEAANRQAALEQPYKWEEEQDGSFGVTPLFVMSNIRSAFKAGAEWMAGQGETHEAEIIESVPFGGTKWRRCIKVWLDDQFQAKGDKVIVQIRKK